jgi:hypothetical protein
VDLVHLGGVHEAVPAGQHAPVDHDAVESIAGLVGQPVLDVSQPLPVARKDWRAGLEQQVGGGLAEIDGGRLPPEPGAA